VVRRFGDVLANDAVSFRADLGEVVAILGPNGAGKTTLILQLLGLLVPTSGTIHVGGADVVADPLGVKRIASYQPQGHTAMGGVEVRRALEYTGRLRGMTVPEARRQAADLAGQFGLHDVLDQPLNRLSGGWRRLADVAAAFMGHPRLIVLDEPTNDLDPLHRRLVWGRLDALRRSRESTCLLVTHNLLEAERVVDRVVIMSRGRTVACGSPGALKRRLGSGLRLDVYVGSEPEAAGTLTALAALGRVRRGRPGHWQFFLGREDVPAAMATLLAETGAGVDDFRLAPPSLEDVYLDLEEPGRAVDAA
jgi:ABC-type multidrug transport system ATPase subunit